MKKIIIVSILLLSAISVSAQIKGLLLDSDRKPVSGAEIALSENPSVKTVSGVDGSFTIDAYPGEYLTVSHSNGLLWRFEIKAKEQVYILQKEAVIIQTGLTTRNIESNTAAISFITSDKIDDFNTERLYAPMYGTLSGLTVLQNLGWDWSSVPDLYIRGAGTLLSKTPLLVVDGFTRDISYLTSADIESISVLKDAAATALYGIQGANGVIVMTTKRGTYNSMKTEIDYSFGIDRPYDMPKYADALTYAKAVNEALYYDGLPQRYSQTELNAYASGKYPDLYPDVDWLDEGLRNLATNHHLGMSFSGGGKNLRYYTHIDYQNYMGLLAHAKDNAEYSTQLRKNHLSARVNLDVNISKTTEMKVGLYGLLYETQNPPGGEAAIFPLLYNTPANAFPIKTSNGYWGSSDYFQYNPIAKIADTGYANLNRRGLQADLRLNQDLSFILKGLQASVAVAWDNTAAYNEQQKKNYQYQVCVPGIANDGSIFTVSEDIFGENNTLAYSSSLNSQQMNSTFEAKIAYQRDFGKHWMDANVVYRQESLVPMGRNTIRKYQNVMFFGGYSYDSRFFLDVVANYYGSSVLLKGAKFDFYPAVSASWVMSNEDFIQANAIDFLKLRASWGRSGHTGFGYELDRYFYVSGNNYFYQSSNVSTPGMKESVLPLSELKSQLSESINLGLDLRLFKKFGLTADVFAEKRSRILLDTDSFYSGILGNTPPPDFSGEVGTYGTEISLSWENKSGDFSYSIGTDFSFVRSIVLENNEGKTAFDYLSQKRKPVGQFYGLEAIGFFNSEAEIASSPQQTFSQVRPGDIKYKDQNNDNVIDNNDFKAFGYSTLMPEIYYGLNLGLQWKNLGFKAYFQGTANYSTILNTPGLYMPLGKDSNLSSWYMEDNVRWTQATASEANLPRLSTIENRNNTVNSTLWLADASYFKLRNLYVYYNLPSKWFSKNGKIGMQVYFRGENLFSLDKISYSNPDDVGTYYPDVKSLWCGINFSF